MEPRINTDLRTIDAYGLNTAVSPAVQLRTLRTIYDRVAMVAASGQIPVVEIDLDLCGVMPVFRTREALRTTGEEFGIAEFLKPEVLSVLPGYSDEAWSEFIESMHLESSYPRLLWKEGGKAARKEGTVFGRFHDLYWTTEWIKEDSPTPGLGALAHRVGELGGRVVFISGRWLPEQVAGTLSSLRRAGIVDPALVIGNPWHETLRVSDGRVLSDAEIKAFHQTEIRDKYGVPVAIFDDRIKNREAVVHANRDAVSSVAIAIPSFTYDRASLETPLRISTFETFDYAIEQLPKRTYMIARYPQSGLGQPWRGLYEGLGKNNLPYVLPRIVGDNDERWAGFPRPYSELLTRFAEGGIAEFELLERSLETVPAEATVAMQTAMVEAEELADRGLAAPFPETPADRHSLWLSLVASWLHSRDIDQLMRALGFPVGATGVHDMLEHVPGQDVITAIEGNLRKGRNYGAWLPRWVATVGIEAPVNVGFLNPALLVSTWQWTPRAKIQDAMDVHRLSSHHNGDSRERYDPIEAAINNLLHQREGRHGIRKEPVEAWAKIAATLRSETGAEDVAKNSAGRNAVRDAVPLARGMEVAGILTPWGLVAEAS